MQIFFPMPYVAFAFFWTISFAVLGSHVFYMRCVKTLRHVKEAIRDEKAMIYI